MLKVELEIQHLQRGQIRSGGWRQPASAQMPPQLNWLTLPKYLGFQDPQGGSIF